MLTCHLLHERHDKHIVVDGEVHLFIDWRQLKLVWSHLVMTCLTRNAKFESLYLKVFHEGSHTLRDSTKIVVVHLLILS